MKITNQITRYYILFYALYSMTQRIIPISVFCVGPLAGILYKLIVGVGGCLALVYLVSGFKKWKMNSLFALLGGFILVLCITTLLNRSYNFFDNVLGVITFGVQLILFFSYYHMTEKKEFSFTIQLTAVASSILWNICCAISLAQYLLNLQYRIFKFTDCIFMRDRHRIFLCITAYLSSLYRRRKNVGQTFSSLCSTKPCAFFGWNDCCLFSALLSDAEYRQTDGAAAQRNRPCPR